MKRNIEFKDFGSNISISIVFRDEKTEETEDIITFDYNNYADRLIDDDITTEYETATEALKDISIFLNSETIDFLNYELIKKNCYELTNEEIKTITEFLDISIINKIDCALSNIF